MHTLETMDGQFLLRQPLSKRKLAFAKGFFKIGDGDEVLLNHVLRALQLLQECHSPRIESHREHMGIPVWQFYPRAGEGVL